MYNKLLFFGLMLSSVLGCNSNEPSPPIDQPEESIYLECLTSTSTSSLEVVTWNLEHYPLSETTLTEVKDIILNLDADVISMQEISSLAVFET